MKRTIAFLVFIIFTTTVYGYNVREVTEIDTNEVIRLNNNGYNNRLTNPRQTVNDAEKALELAKKIDYKKGIAESYRVRGIGEYYLNKPDSAYSSYLNAQEVYKDLKDERGVAKVSNNIGNLYQMIDYSKALDYFGQAEVIAEKYADRRLIASLQLNIGNVYNRMRNYNKALQSYNKSLALFEQLKDSVNLIQCLENLGDVYYKLKNFTESEKLLLDANKRAKDLDMNASVAAINMVLTDIYIARGKFAEAKKYIDEGIAHAEIVNDNKDNKVVYEYKHSLYELERKRKNYSQALLYLEQIYQLDSTINKNLLANALNIQDERIKQAETQMNVYNSRIKFWAVTVVAALLLVVVALLVTNVRRKSSTNLKLQELNQEVSRQKDNLDRINHHLEEIIDERTKDLQVKNKKLSEYSSYLSHQIRGPIATLKGLMNLESEGLVGQKECINLMDKCVSEIDNKIIEMSDMLHDKNPQTSS